MTDTEFYPRPPTIVSLIAMLIAVAPSPSVGEETTKKPLAEIEVRRLASTDPAQTDRAPPLSVSALSTVSNPAAEYLPLKIRPLANAEAERDPARIRLLLNPHVPSLQRLIDVFVYLDGQPFQAVREQWIDERLKAASGVRNEAQPPAAPAPNDTGTAGIAAMLQPPRRNPTLGDRVSFYLNAVESPVERREVTALLEKWPGGHPLLLLTPGISWRCVAAPIVSLLDTNQDSTLSSEEISAAPARLKVGDVNEDGIIERSELDRTSQQQAHSSNEHPLLVMIDPAESAEQTIARDRLMALMAAPANIAIRVDFRSQGNIRSSLQLIALNAAGHAKKLDVSVGGSVITIDEGPQHIELSAAELSAPRVTTTEPEQIAVGAIIDGYPLFRLLDADDDGRLTAREARKLPSLLKELDRNQDNAVAADEIPTPIRLAISRGPLVNRLMSSATAATRSKSIRQAKQAPDWFASMDANRDGDLARQEFSGTAEQFEQLDQDKDGLVSITEALRLENSN